MNGWNDTRGSSRSTTSQLLLALLGGNLLAVLCVAAFRPFDGAGGDSVDSLVLTVGVLSLIVAGLLFLASGIRRDTRRWWMVTALLNVLQVGRLIPAIAAIAAWPDGAPLGGVVWGFFVVPSLGLLSAVGIVMTVLKFSKSRRRRLPRAA
jgi:hypothetical protein